MSIFKKTIKHIIPYKTYSGARDMFRYILSFRYIGSKYVCPFCKGRFSSFLSGGFDFPILKEKQVVGGGFRLNSTCPRCFSGDRERLIYIYIKKNKQYLFSKEIKLLHVAPEINLGKALKSYPNIKYSSADLNSPLVEVRMDITKINKPNETYDVIICNHVLEHIQDDIKAMYELFRVLKKGGFAILQVPVSFCIDSTIEDETITEPIAREAAFGQKDHVRIYGKDYVQRLESVGFVVTIYDYNEDLEQNEILKYGLLKDEKIFLCIKE
ncbi:MAG: methyltransferase domain-containing protein [bacterium]